MHEDKGWSIQIMCEILEIARAAFQNKLKKKGMIPSMSRVSRCIDNGLVEGFQSQIKDMLRILHPHIQSVEEMERAVCETYDYYKTEYPLPVIGGKLLKRSGKKGWHQNIVNSILFS